MDETDGENERNKKKSARIKKGVLIGAVVFACVVLAAVFPAIVVLRGCGLI